MNLLYLKEFLVLADTKSYSEASERLYMNQSTLSKHIKSLEEELGIALFNRTTRRVRLTEYGQQFLPYAEQISHLASQYEAERNRKDQGMLTIGTIPTMAQYNIVHLILSFKEKHPDVQLKIIEGDTIELEAGLLKSNYDFAFLRISPLSLPAAPLRDQTMEQIPYQTDHLIAILPDTHPLSCNECITFRQLKNYRLCLLKETTLLYNLCIHACKTANFIPNIFYESHRIDNILEMSAFGNCIALLPDQHLQTFSGKYALEELHLAMIPIDPPVTTTVSLCYLKKDTFTDAERYFLSFMNKILGV